MLIINCPLFHAASRILAPKFLSWFSISALVYFKATEVYKFYYFLSFVSVDKQAEVTVV